MSGQSALQIVGMTDVMFSIRKRTKYISVIEHFIQIKNLGKLVFMGAKNARI
jgi:hypothetical protein